MPIFSPQWKSRRKTDNSSITLRNGPVIVAIDAAEFFPGMGIEQVEPVRLRRRQRYGADYLGQSHGTGYER